MRPRSYQRIPARTVRTAWAACPKGTPAMLLCDRLDVLFEDEEFADQFPSDGRPGFSPGQLTLVPSSPAETQPRPGYGHLPDGRTPVRSLGCRLHPGMCRPPPPSAGPARTHPVSPGPPTAWRWRRTAPAAAPAPAGHGPGTATTSPEPATNHPARHTADSRPDAQHLQIRRGREQCQAQGEVDHQPGRQQVRSGHTPQPPDPPDPANTPRSTDQGPMTPAHSQPRAPPLRRSHQAEPTNLRNRIGPGRRTPGKSSTPSRFTTARPGPSLGSRGCVPGITAVSRNRARRVRRRARQQQKPAPQVRGPDIPEPLGKL